jgi:hypothetical protein
MFDTPNPYIKKALLPLPDQHALLYNYGAVPAGVIRQLRGI